MTDSSRDWRRFRAGRTPSTVVLDELFYRAVPAGALVLDFGCAWGRVARELTARGYRTIGFDLNQAELKRAAGLAGRARFVAADGRGLPFADRSFDACLIQAFLSAIVEPADRALVLDEARRVLKPGGLAYLGVFGLNRDNPAYRERYLAGLALTGEEGTFIVTEDGSPRTPELFRVHHYSEAELRGLLAGRLEIEVFRKTYFTSYHGHRADGFIVLARRV